MRLYKLSYFDCRLQEQIEHTIEVDTQRKAYNRANKLLEGKEFARPKLEEVSEC